VALTANSGSTKSTFSVRRAPYRAIVRRNSSELGWPAFVARMIDNVLAFDGPTSSFTDSPYRGLYPRHAVHESVHSVDDFEPWLGQVVHFPKTVIQRARKSIPSEWIEGDEGALEELLSRLYERRAPFPNWRQCC
jgi:hypothetical protein